MLGSDTVDLIGCARKDSSAGVVAVDVFGSAARGDVGPSSDLDLGVRFEKPLPATIDGGRLALDADLAVVEDAVRARLKD